MDQDLNAKFDELAKRIAELEAEVATLKANASQLDEDTLMAISAAVSAYLGVKAKVKQVHFAAGRSWTTEGRAAVHRRSVPHVR